MITAEEFLNEEQYYSVSNDFDTQQAMIEFAKLHVEAALKEASEKSTLESRLYSKFQGRIEKTEDLGQELNLEEQLYVGINENSILNAYSLTLIK